MSKTAIFIDTGNIYYCLNKKFPKRKLDYTKYLAQMVFIMSKAYVSQVNDSTQRFIEYLQSIEIDVVAKKPRKRKVVGQYIWETNWNIEMTLDIMESIYERDISHVIIGSNDVGLMPLIDELLREGIRVTIFAVGISKVFQGKVEIIEIDESLLYDMIAV